jgi:hypothetical protein
MFSIIFIINCSLWPVLYIKYNCNLMYLLSTTNATMCQKVPIMSKKTRIFLTSISLQCSASMYRVHCTPLYPPTYLPKYLHSTHLPTKPNTPQSWASASRPMPQASVLRHPASQSGTVALRYRTGYGIGIFSILVLGWLDAGQSGIQSFLKIVQRYCR